MANSTTLDSEDGSLPTDQLFDLLSDVNRRTVLEYVLNRDSAVHVDELLDELAPVEGSSGTENLRAVHHARLIHIHLPKLSTVGVVEYDSETDSVEPTPVIEEVTPYLEWARTYERR